MAFTSNKPVLTDSISASFTYIRDNLDYLESHLAIPSSAIILVESDTAISGYTLLTDKDDYQLYIGSGSGAGGLSGGTDRAGGSWTISGETHDHTHETSHTHTFTADNHTHQWYNATDASHHDQSYDSNGDAMDLNKIGQGSAFLFVLSITPDSYSGAADKYAIQDCYAASTGVTGTTDDADDPTTDSISTTAVSSDGTWRPVGRILTRQQRN
jgi:hypothetical protein